MMTILTAVVTIILSGVIVALAVARIHSQRQLERANKELMGSYYSFGQVLDKLSLVVDSFKREPVSMCPDSGHAVLLNVDYSRGFYIGVNQRCVYHPVDMSMPMSGWGLVKVPFNGRSIERIAIAHIRTDDSLEPLTYWNPWHDDRIDEWIEMDASDFLHQSRQLEQVH